MAYRVEGLELRGITVSGLRVDIILEVWVVGFRG